MFEASKQKKMENTKFGNIKDCHIFILRYIDEINIVN